MHPVFKYGLKMKNKGMPKYLHLKTLHLACIQRRYDYANQGNSYLLFCNGQKSVRERTITFRGHLINEQRHRSHTGDIFEIRVTKQKLLRGRLQ